MPSRSFYFYHFSKEAHSKKNGVSSVWVPLTLDASKMIEHIQSKLPDTEISVESKLTDFISGKNIQIKEPKSLQKNIILYAQSDTLANSVSVIGKRLSDHKISYIVPKNSSEKADLFFKSRGIKYKNYSYQLLKSIRPDVFLLLNDWSKEAQRIIAHCHLLHIPVICMQESVIDFGDRFKRMQWADEVFVQGSQTVLDLVRNSYYITGNPRYESIQPRTTNGEEVLINCNFTYGIYEDKRESWLNDIASVLSTHNIDYAISQHPRDKGNLEKYKKVIPSSSGSIESQLTQSRFLITRFSSLIHEALVVGVPVIYYNPHGEEMKYDFEFDGKILQLARTKEELENCVANLKNLAINESYLNEYLSRHCICRNSMPSANIAQILGTINFAATSPSFADLIKTILYHPTIKNFLSKFTR